MVGLPSWGLEDSSLSELGVYELLRRPLRLHSVSLKAYSIFTRINSISNFYHICFHAHLNDIFYDRLRRRELHLPTALEPDSIFQAELECLLGSKSDSQEHRDEDGDKSFTGW